MGSRKPQNLSRRRALLDLYIVYSFNSNITVLLCDAERCRPDTPEKVVRGRICLDKAIQSQLYSDAWQQHSLKNEHACGRMKGKGRSTNQ